MTTIRGCLDKAQGRGAPEEDKDKKPKIYCSMTTTRGCSDKAQGRGAQEEDKDIKKYLSLRFSLYI